MHSAIKSGATGIESITRRPLLPGSLLHKSCQLQIFF